MLRQVPASQIKTAVIEAVERSAYELPADYLQALALAQKQEQSPLGRSIILTLRDNAAYAQEQQIATCQDHEYSAYSVEPVPNGSKNSKCNPL